MNRRSSAKAGASSRSYRVGGFLNENRAELRSVCDIYDAHRDHLLKLLNAGEAVQSVSRHEDVLANPNVDAVILAVPDHLHFSIGQTVLQAEKHLYLEKPTIHHWNERTILGNRGRSIRLRPSMRHATEQRCGLHPRAARDFRSGQTRAGGVCARRLEQFPLAVPSHYTRAATTRPRLAAFPWTAPKVPYDKARYDSWRYFPDYGGGLLADILTYWADVAQWMLDDNRPQAAQSSGGIYTYHDGRENPDTVNALTLGDLRPG